MAFGLIMFGMDHSCENYSILKKWCVNQTRLKLLDVVQVLYNDGKNIQEDVCSRNIVWFLLTLTDGNLLCHVELQIDKNAKMIDNNIMGLETIDEYLKMLMYVDKKEWNDFFECGVVKDKDLFYLHCFNC